MLSARSLYDPRNWYWAVGQEGEIFSSATPGYVAADDPIYVAWLAEGNVPTVIAERSELAEVLANASGRGVPGAAVLAVAPSTWDTLEPERILPAVLAAGVVVTISGQPTLSGIYEFAGQSWQNMKDEAQYVATFQEFSNGEQTLSWPARGTVVAFASPAEFLSVVRLLAKYLSAWTTWLAGDRSESAPAFGKLAT